MFYKTFVGQSSTGRQTFDVGNPIMNLLGVLLKFG